MKNLKVVMATLTMFSIMTCSILLTGCENPFKKTQETVATTEATTTTPVTTTEETTTVTEITTPLEKNSSADAAVCERMGIDVYLHGTVEEKAEQLCNALKAKYPDLPFEQRKNGVCLPVERDTTLSAGDIDIQLNKWLNNDFENIKSKELPEVYEYAKYFVTSDLGLQCNDYFLELTQNVFIQTT